MPELDFENNVVPQAEDNEEVTPQNEENKENEEINTQPEEPTEEKPVDEKEDKKKGQDKDKEEKESGDAEEPAKKSQKKSDREKLALPWSERTNGGFLVNFLRAIVRAIKYMINPEYRYAVKLMHQYNTKSIFQEEYNKEKASRERSESYREDEKENKREKSEPTQEGPDKEDQTREAPSPEQPAQENPEQNTPNQEVPDQTESVQGPFIKGLEWNEINEQAFEEFFNKVPEEGYEVHIVERDNPENKKEITGEHSITLNKEGLRDFVKEHDIIASDAETYEFLIKRAVREDEHPEKREERLVKESLAFKKFMDVCEKNGGRFEYKDDRLDQPQFVETKDLQEFLTRQGISSTTLKGYIKRCNHFFENVIDKAMGTDKGVQPQTVVQPEVQVETTNVEQPQVETTLNEEHPSAPVIPTEPIAPEQVNENEQWQVPESAFIEMPMMSEPMPTPVSNEQVEMPPTIEESRNLDTNIPIDLSETGHEAIKYTFYEKYPISFGIEDENGHQEILSTAHLDRYIKEHDIKYGTVEELEDQLCVCLSRDLDARLEREWEQAPQYINDNIQNFRDDVNQLNYPQQEEAPQELDMSQYNENPIETADRENLVIDESEEYTSAYEDSEPLGNGLDFSEIDLSDYTETRESSSTIEEDEIGA